MDLWDLSLVVSEVRSVFGMSKKRINKVCWDEEFISSVVHLYFFFLSINVFFFLVF